MSKPLVGGIFVMAARMDKDYVASDPSSGPPWPVHLVPSFTLWKMKGSD